MKSTKPSPPLSETRPGAKQRSRLFQAAIDMGFKPADPTSLGGIVITGVQMAAPERKPRKRATDDRK